MKLTASTYLSILVLCIVISLYQYISIAISSPLRLILTSFGFIAPLLLSAKAILYYDGFDAEKDHKIALSVRIQKVILILCTQSIPLSALLSFSWLILLCWLVIMTLTFLMLRNRVADIYQQMKASRTNNTADIKTPPATTTTINVIKYEPTFAIYHPHAHQRAGGEMVLWRFIHALTQSETFTTLFSLSTLHAANKRGEIATNVPTPSITVFSNTVPQSFITTSEIATQKRIQKMQNNSNNNNQQQQQQDTTDSRYQKCSIAIENDRRLYNLIDDLAETTNVLNSNKNDNKNTNTGATQGDNINTAGTNNNNMNSTQINNTSTSNPTNTIITNEKIAQYIIESTTDTFGIDLTSRLNTNSTTTSNSPNNKRNNNQNTQINLNFMFSPFTSFSDAQHYPRLTLILQTINALYPLLMLLIDLLFPQNIILSMLNNNKSSNEEKQKTILIQKFPLLIIDTAGYPIVSLLCNLVGIPCGAYVHYPIIQNDMIQRNLDGVQAIQSIIQLQNNNKQEKEKDEQKQNKLQLIKKYIKHVYFMFILLFYTKLLSLNRILYSNGTWTYNHLYTLLIKNFNRQQNEDNNNINNSNGKNQFENIFLQCCNFIFYKILFKLIFFPTFTPPNVLCQPDLINGDKMNITQIIRHDSNTNQKQKQKEKEQQDNFIILSKLYPPCNLPSIECKKPQQLINCKYITQYYPIFIVLGQYRPEKQQLLILQSFLNFLQQRVNNNLPLSFNNYNITLLFIGTYRPTDIILIKQIYDFINNNYIINNDKENNNKQKDNKIPLSNYVKCLFNINLNDLQYILKHSLCGIHCMQDEHFGIAVAELLFNCYTIIGHKSAGPYLDIIVPSITADNIIISDNDSNKNNKRENNNNNNTNNNDIAVGFVASTIDEYKLMMSKVMDYYTQDIKHITNDCHEQYYRQKAIQKEQKQNNKQQQQQQKDNDYNDHIGNETICIYTSPLQQMSYRGQQRALNMFNVDIFDKCVDEHVIQHIQPYFL